MASVFERELVDTCLTPIPDNLISINGELSEFLSERIRTYSTGERTEATLPGVVPKPFSIESFHRFLLDEQSLGPLDDHFTLTYVKKLYSTWHMMAVPNTTWPRVRNIQMEGIDPSLRAHILSSLYTNASRLATNLLLDTSNNVDEVALGINGGKNKSLSDLLHLQIVGFDPHDWSDCTFRDIQTQAPHRWNLLSHNDGFDDVLPGIPALLSQKYPDLLHDSWAITKGASVFMECKASLYMLSQQENFPDLMVDVDGYLRSLLKASHILPDQQSFSFVLTQHRNSKNALLVFAPSAKIGKEPSGMCETIHDIFTNQTATGDIRALSPEENGVHLNNSNIFAGYNR